jgi:hypothetical protein
MLDCNLKWVKHTPALEEAAIAEARATNGCGLPVMLCPDPFDPLAVSRAMQQLSGWLTDPNFFFIDCRDPEDKKPGTSRLAAITNLILLANLYKEHVLAGNFQ